MTALIALIRKDLILFLADRRALLLSLTMPVMLGAFFGYLFGGSGSPENVKIEIAVVSQDQGEISNRIVAGLKADGSLHVQELALAVAREQVLKGKLNAAILIPEGFSKAAGAALFGGRDKPEIQIFYDPSQSAVLGMVKGMLTQQVMQHVSAEMFSGKSGQAFIDQSIEQIDAAVASDPARAELRDFLKSVKKFQTHNQSAAPASGPAPSGGSAGLSMPFVTRDQAMSSGPRYNGYAHSFAGMSVQFILFMGLDAGVGILLARRLGLWKRLLAAPIGSSTILSARAISCSLIALGLLAFVYLVGALFFKVSIAGSAVGFVGVSLCFALFTATFGLFVAAFGGTPEATRGLATFATLIMVMLGGSWVPAFMFPQWLQTATLLVPTRWAVDGLEAMTWRGLPLEAALAPVAALLGFSLLFGALALWRFGRDDRA
ncbi:MAG: ABC-2 transporter permease [Comamonadaceae bacterium]